MGSASISVEAALARFRSSFDGKVELSLGPIRTALARLHNPHLRLPPTIHVAGTNGKGSTGAFLRAMAEAAELAVHVSTSPHLVRFNERIRLAGDLIEDAALISHLDQVHAVMGDLDLSYFEAGLAASFLAFAQTPADLLILEVGLGGRFDASNVIEAPAVSVITPIDYDHAAFLGTDLGRIAWEKAGIIKSGRPVVSAPQADIVNQVIAEEALAQSAPLWRVTGSDIAAFEGHISLFGAHQRANAALAARALTVWGDQRIEPTHLLEGAGQAVWPGRLQKLADGPLTRLVDGAELWVDGGHNPHAGRALAGALKDMSRGSETVMVAAMMGGKDMAGFLKPFAGHISHIVACPNPGGARAGDPADIEAAARAAGIPSCRVETLEAALKEAVRLAGCRADCATNAERGRILMCGSLYLVGEALMRNGEAPT